MSHSAGKESLRPGFAMMRRQSAVPSRLHTRQTVKRAMILAAARGIIEQNGSGVLTMRALAKHCDMSVQTLYSNVGSRNELVNTAVAEFFDTQLTVVQWQVSDGRSLLDGYIAMLHHSIIAFERYSREVLRLLIDDHAERGALSTAIFGFNARIFRGALTDCAARGDLRSWVNPDEVAESLHAVSHNTMLKWLDGMKTGEVERTLAIGIGMPLLGATTGEEADRIEKDLYRLCRAG